MHGIGKARYGIDDQIIYAKGEAATEIIQQLAILGLLINLQLDGLFDFRIYL